MTPVRSGVSLTATERLVLEAAVAYENQTLAASMLGMAPQTFKNHLQCAYRKLDTTSLIGAAKAVGWVMVR